eukprot:gene11913-14070_t
MPLEALNSSLELIENDDYELHEVDLERDGLDLLTGYACSFSTVSNEDAIGEDDIWCEENVQDLDDAAKNRPDVEELPQRQYLKILMAGESGLGKTTFARNLFQDYHPEVTVHDGTATSKETFLNAPEELCTKVEIESAKSGHTYCYSVQDTPGYGDDLELEQHVDMIVSFVKRQKAAYMQMDVDPQRSRDLADVEDPRVDICLYFIPAHRLKTVDVLFMQALSKEVALIPVLAKADSMTAEEIQQFRAEVMASLEGVDVLHFPSEMLTAAGSSPAHVPPFAVVASNHMAQTAPDRRCRFWPVREYNWGTCEAKRTDHSDFAVLRRLLFEFGYHAIRQETARRYYAYRSTELDWEARKRKEAKQQRMEASLQKQAWRSAAWQGAKVLLAVVAVALVVGSCNFRAHQLARSSVRHVELENQELKRQVRALENFHDHDEGKLKEMEWQLSAKDAELGNALSELHMARLLLNESSSNAEALATQLWAAAEQHQRECEISSEEMANTNYNLEYTNSMLKATERKMADLEQEIHQCRLETPTCNCSRDKQALQTMEDMEESEHMLRHLQEKVGKCESRVKKDEELMEAMEYRYTECYKKKRWQTIHLPFGDYFGG